MTQGIGMCPWESLPSTMGMAQPSLLQAEPAILLPLIEHEHSP